MPSHTQRESATLVTNRDIVKSMENVQPTQTRVPLAEVVASLSLAIVVA